MSDSFGTIPFTVLASGLGRVQQANVTVTPIPGGNVAYFDYGGQQPRELPYTLLMSEANFRTMEGTVGGTAQLVTAVDGTVSCAVLMSLSRSQRIPGGTTYAAARFTVVTA